MIRLIISSLLLLTLAATALAEEVVHEVSWAELAKRGELLGGEVQADGTLKIVNTNEAKKSVPIIEFKEPGITAVRYALLGKVRYEDVQGTGFLEMWNYFPNGGFYFSRTLGEFGPMGKISGTSPWRTFVLPFFSEEEAGSPERLELNVVFDGPGTVYLGPLKLVQYTEGEDPLANAAQPGAWWSDRTAGLIGAIAGTILGLCGALIGTLAGLGKARRLVLGLDLLLIVFGTISLVVGMVALSVGQPYTVYNPLLLVGIICLAVMGSLRPVLSRRYEQAELRKIAAMDIGG